MTEKQILSFKPASYLNMSATNIPSPCRIKNIDPNDVMILPHDANPCRIAFSERIGRALTIFQAGFALNIVGSFVNGLMPLRSFVAGFLIRKEMGMNEPPSFAQPTVS